mmetsp:Transcript_2052/g.5745  ORF Transcript_2052/g.5745 Transcript_2052/m.5745 type:complete len:385 (-) Transcript_2052:146-1300(-)
MWASCCPRCAVVGDVEGMVSEPDAQALLAWQVHTNELYAFAQRLVDALRQLRDDPPSLRTVIVGSVRAVAIVKQRSVMEAALESHLDEDVRVRGTLRAACAEGADALRTAGSAGPEKWTRALKRAGFCDGARLRDTQLLPLQLIAAGHDGIVALPTGAGRSLIMELPALTDDARSAGRMAVAFVPFRQCGQAWVELAKRLRGDHSAILMAGSGTHKDGRPVLDEDPDPKLHADDAKVFVGCDARPSLLILTIEMLVGTLKSEGSRTSPSARACALVTELLKEGLVAIVGVGEVDELFYGGYVSDAGKDALRQTRLSTLSGKGRDGIDAVMNTVTHGGDVDGDCTAAWTFQVQHMATALRCRLGRVSRAAAVSAAAVCAASSGDQ